MLHYQIMGAQGVFLELPSIGRALDLGLTQTSVDRVGLYLIVCMLSSPLRSTVGPIRP